MSPTQGVQDTGRLGLSIKPVSEVRMEDFAAVVNPKKGEALLVLVVPAEC